VVVQLPRRGEPRRGTARQGIARPLRASSACGLKGAPATVRFTDARGARRVRRWPAIAVGKSATPVSDRFVAWLLSRSDGQLCAIVATLFWVYTVANKMLVRGTLLAVKQVPVLATPEAYGLQYLIMAPALVFVHWTAFRIGLPRAHRARALLVHVLLGLALAVFARFALDVADASLYYGGQMSLFEFLQVGIRGVVHAPLVALSTGLDVAFQYSIALGLIGGVLTWKRYQREAAERAALALETERARRMALRRQLDPHSLFNTLNAVAAAIRTAPATAIAMIAALGDLLRESLEEEREISTVEEEFALAGRYLSLYALRFPDRLTVEIDSTKECAGVLVPTLLLQPLVENAALHGVESGAARVDVRLAVERLGEAGVRIAIENTVSPEAQLPAPADSPGIGLRNTWNRLTTHYGQRFDLHWERPSADRVRLVLDHPAAPLAVGV